MTTRDQVRDHRPSSEIKAALALASKAEEEARDMGAHVHRLWGNVADPGDHIRNAAICAWRVACGAADKVHEIVMDAAATEATAQNFDRLADDLANAELAPDIDPANHNGVIRRYRKTQRDKIEVAKRLAAQAAAVYDVEVAQPLATARHFIELWENGRGYPHNLSRLEYVYPYRKGDDLEKIVDALLDVGAGIGVTTVRNPVPAFPDYTVVVELDAHPKALDQIDAELQRIIDQQRKGDKSK